jgi:A/G-specific adenine glycosylase
MPPKTIHNPTIRYQLPTSEEKRLAILSRSLERWYQTEGRTYPWRNTTDTYQQIVVEVLLQPTRAEKVASVYSEFFSKWDSWQSLANAEKADVTSVIYTLGLWRRRSDTLVNLAKKLSETNFIFPSDRTEIDKLPGVGLYVGNAIELFLFGSPMPLLDINMARVLERYLRPSTLSDIRHDPWLRAASSHLIKSARDTKKTNWAILDIGALYCHARSPNCEICPIKKGCSKLI